MDIEVLKRSPKGHRVDIGKWMYVAID